MRTALLVAVLMLGGCSLGVVPRADPTAPASTPEGVLVSGRITYIIDGESRLPYGAFRPSIPAPHLDLLQLEDGSPLQTHAVSNADGSYTWRIRPGHYVISGIGQGQFTDDYRITWPRLAFQVGASGGPVYLGHLKLVGRRYAEPYTLSTGTKGVSRGIRYQFVVEDEAGRMTSSGAPDKSLMFHRPNMPIGEPLVSRWRASKEQLIAEIFGR